MDPAGLALMIYKLSFWLCDALNCFAQKFLDMSEAVLDYTEKYAERNGDW